MNIETLQNIYVNSIDKIFDPDNFKIIADHHNNIFCESFTNRALVFMQNRYATDVRSIEAWEMIGRQVNNKAIPVGIVKSIIENEYFDTKSNKAVNVKELTPDEFRNAIRIGLIDKQQNIKGIECSSVYDIRDTEIIVEDTTENKKSLKLSSIYNILSDIGLDVVKEDIKSTTVDIDKLTVVIGNDDVESKLIACLDALAIGVMNICGIDIEENPIIRRVSSEYAVYSVLSYYDMNTTDIEFESTKDIIDEDLDILTEVLDTIEALIRSNIIFVPGKSTCSIKPDKIARASLLLSILESNYQATKLKGD